MEKPAANRARVALIASVILTMVLYAMPMGEMIAYPLVLLSTLAHELGHGITASLTGGSFEQFVLYADGSGRATWSGEAGRIQRALVSMGGLVGPAAVGAGIFAIGRNPKLTKSATAMIGVCLLIADVLIVRNAFGIFFIGLFGLISLFIGVRGSKETCQWFAYFIGVQLALSVFSRSDYLFVQYAQTAEGRMPSDVQQMADALFLPYWIWGGVCGGVSLGCLMFGLVIALRK
jgi:hypothetical protein